MLRNSLLWLVASIVASGVVPSQVRTTAQEANGAGQSGAAESMKTSTDEMKPLLPSKWLETSYEHEGVTSVMTEMFDGNESPVDVVWDLSQQKGQQDLTRQVLYGDTEITEGSFRFGTYSIDTSVRPNRITFEKSGFVIPGIFRMEGETLVLALPSFEWDFSTDSMQIGRRPSSFEIEVSRQQGGRGHRAVGPTGDRLRRMSEDR